MRKSKLNGDLTSQDLKKAKLLYLDPPNFKLEEEFGEMDDTRLLKVERSTSTAHRLHHYDGICGNVHGHNIVWKAEVTVDMEASGPDNMPLDLKDVSGLIDDVDHAFILNVNDPILESVDLDGFDASLEDLRQMDQEGIYSRSGIVSVIGKVFLFWSDPTCEVLSQWMADQIAQLDGVNGVKMTVRETEKYGITTHSRKQDGA